MTHSLDPLLRPKSVAVIGASRRKGSLGHAIFGNLLHCGFQGTAYPVHPTAKSVHSVRAYASIKDVPEAVDLAVIAVPSKFVLAMAQECAEAGVRSMVVITAGFREVGGEGVELEAKLTKLVRDAGIRLVGPNCLGVINTDPEILLDATFVPNYPHNGRIGFLTQSGALGVAILDHGRTLGLGVSTFVSVGNKADVSGNDILEYWENDDNTDVVLLYLESFGNPRKFPRIARRVARKKPVLAVKSGRSAAGQRATSSHTGALAGVDIAVDALFRQTGVIRVNTLEELFNSAMLLCNQPVPASNRVAIVTNAGGPAILATDACVAHGLEIPRLTAETEAKLTELLPAEASVLNPVDMIASATADSFEQALKILLTDPNIDSVIVIYVPPLSTQMEEVAAAIERGAAGTTKTVLCNFLGTHGMTDSLRGSAIPSYAFPESAAIALARATSYGQWRRRDPGNEIIFKDADPRAAAAAISLALERGEDVWLRPDEVSTILSAYGIRQPISRLVTSADEAAAFAAEIGFPVALKLVSDTITHKTDVRGVRLGLNSVDDVWDAFVGIEQRLAQHGRAHEMSGVLVQAMVHTGFEFLVGASLDPVFGPLIVAGFGGVNVEVFNDVGVRVHPIRDRDVAEMLEGLRGMPLLKGHRDQSKGDIEALTEAILRVNQIITDQSEIIEFDINPLNVLEPGEGVLALDCRIRVKHEQRTQRKRMSGAWTKVTRGAPMLDSTPTLIVDRASAVTVSGDKSS